MCQDCVAFLTDAQEQAKTNSTFVDGLIENIENQCDLLGPSMSTLVTAALLIQCVFFFLDKANMLRIVFFSLPQCREYVSQYSSLVVQQLMNMVS